jgi:hypothetical protein
MAAGGRDLAVSPVGVPAALAGLALAGLNRQGLHRRVMTAAVGARRTGSAYARFLDRLRWPW